MEDMEVRILKALAHPVRLGIIKKLMNGNLSVCELNEDSNFSQSNLSQHLKILKDSNIVEFEKKGLNIHYKIKNKRIFELINLNGEIVKENLNLLLKQVNNN